MSRGQVNGGADRAHSTALTRRALLLAAGVALPFAGGRMPVASLPAFVAARADWGAAPPAGPMRAHLIERVTVHHTGPPAWWGSPPAPAYLRAIQAFHTGPERRWPDIAYHLLIDLDGGVWEGRSLAHAGDSATAYDPAGHALIAVLGDYDVQHPTAAQVAALRQTVSWLLEMFALDPDRLGGHGDYAATACPGARLAALLPGLLA